MPKVTLEFNLPEESEEYRYAFDGVRYQAALSDFAAALRQKRKYTETAPESWEAVEQMFWDLIGERGIEL